MSPNDVLNKIDTTFDFTIWRGRDKTRIYFNHTSKVDTFLELEVVDNKVMSVIPKWYYTGKSPSSNKWTYNYTREARCFLDDMANYVIELIKAEMNDLSNNGRMFITIKI